MPDNRVHDVSAMTDSELERARRHLMVSLSLAFPGSPVRGPILAHISAIDAELAERASVHVPVLEPHSPCSEVPGGER